MMNKKSAMSAMGYAIALIIILGVVMIISAPMMADKYSNKPPKNTVAVKNLKNQEPKLDVQNEIQNLESRINTRLNNLEQRQNSIEKLNNYSDKYVCTINGTVDELGNISEINSSSDVQNQKILFVCEYRR